MCRGPSIHLHAHKVTDCCTSSDDDATQVESQPQPKNELQSIIYQGTSNLHSTT